MRDLYKLLGEISEMIPHTPETEELRLHLCSIHSSVFYAAPELMGMWWEEAAEVLAEHVDSTQDWHAAIIEKWNPDAKISEEVMRISEVSTQSLEEELKRRKNEEFVKSLSVKDIEAELKRRQEARRNDPDYEEP